MVSSCVGFGGGLTRDAHYCLIRGGGFSDDAHSYVSDGKIFGRFSVISALFRKIFSVNLSPLAFFGGIFSCFWSLRARTVWKKEGQLVAL